MKIVVMGASFGGLHAITTILAGLPAQFSIPILVVQHIGVPEGLTLAKSLKKRLNKPIFQGEPLMEVKKGHIYIAPVEYHMMIEKDLTLSLSVDEKVNFSRPSIDVLFESAAYSFPGETIGILLTGANNDGARGLHMIKESGGITIVESPETAFSPTMPSSAISLFTPDHILSLPLIAPELCSITGDIDELRAEHSHS